MSADNITRVAIFGTGQMGPGIGVVCALAGCRVTIVGRSAESLQRGQGTVVSALDFLADNKAITRRTAKAAMARLAFSHDAASAAPADLVIESIAEHLPTKQQFFHQLEDVFSPDTILASNTSGIRISDIAALMQHPERAVTTHFWNPAHLMPLVDVIKGDKTAQATVDRVYAFLLRCGKKPVVGRKDVAGQVGNRLQHALFREAIYMVQEGIASAEDVETAIKAGFGLRLPVYGPFEHIDASGADLTNAVQDIILPTLCNAGASLPLLRDMVAQGKLGAKTGQGFYDWSQRSVDDLRRRRDLFLVERMKEAR
jgi:3-hydroxybutyryl-CoA dehydrogenase